MTKSHKYEVMFIREGVAIVKAPDGYPEVLSGSPKLLRHVARLLTAAPSAKAKGGAA